MVVLELYGEQFKWRKLTTICTESHNLSLNSIKAFVLEPISTQNPYDIKTSIQEPSQVLIVSGPDYTDIQLSPK